MDSLPASPRRPGGQVRPDDDGPSGGSIGKGEARPCLFASDSRRGSANSTSFLCKESCHSFSATCSFHSLQQHLSCDPDYFVVIEFPGSRIGSGKNTKAEKAVSSLTSVISVSFPSSSLRIE